MAGTFPFSSIFDVEMDIYLSTVSSLGKKRWHFTTSSENHGDLGVAIDPVSSTKRHPGVQKEYVFVAKKSLLKLSF